jgi:hypothetical protein
MMLSAARRVGSCDASLQVPSSTFFVGEGQGEGVTDALKATTSISCFPNLPGTTHTSFQRFMYKMAPQLI